MNHDGWNLEHSFTELSGKFFTKIEPEPVADPAFVVFNHALADELGLNKEALQTKSGVAIFAGNELPEGSVPLAQAYAGHQFGHFTMLGDGRAVLLGEQVTPSGDRLDIQLKGAGRTPYSRGGDGRAALGPMIREYVISEAMHGLGIPTTRSLAVVTTGDAVLREEALPGAIVTRVAASHLRVGTFQYAINYGKVEDVKTLADYAIKRHYPEALKDDNVYLAFLKKVIKRQANTIAKWQLVGFIHGVMNTDNMTISGETIDYGPCAFLDEYDSKAVFSSIDRNGRCAYANQPVIAVWNLARFAETLLPLLSDDQDKAVNLAEAALKEFSTLFEKSYTYGMRAKLGLSNEEAGDRSFIANLLQLMEKHQADYTNTFRALTLKKIEETDLFHQEDFKQWYGEWKERVARQQATEEEIEKLMRANNPAVIPRNHRVEEAITAAENGDYDVLNELLDVLADAYAYSELQEAYAKPPEATERVYQTFCGT